jgi:hypothetical protein
MNVFFQTNIPSLLSVLFLSTVGLADQASPHARWVKASPTLIVIQPGGSPDPKSLERLREVRRPSRQEISLLEVIVLNSLPLVEVLPERALDDVDSLPALARVDTQLIDYNGFVNVKSRNFGKLVIDWRSSKIGPTHSSGLQVWGCGKILPKRYRPMSWEAIHLSTTGEPIYSRNTGWYDYGICKGYVYQSYQVKPKSYLHGAALVFRTHCKQCTMDKRDELHVITPGDATWRNTHFEHIFVSLTKGGFADTSFDKTGIHDWEQHVTKIPFKTRTNLTLQALKTSTMDNAQAYLYLTPFREKSFL